MAIALISVTRRVCLLVGVTCNVISPSLERGMKDLSGARKLSDSYGKPYTVE